MTTTDNPDYVNWFRLSSPYINAYRGKTFVLMLPGAAVEHDNFANIVHDIVLLSSLGVRLVVVHGARPQIDRHLASAGITSQFHNNLRITDQSFIDLISQAVGQARYKIEAVLSRGLPNSPMYGAHLRVASGNFITAKPCGVIDGIDLQHTGCVRRVDSKALSHTLDLGSLALLSPLGFSPTGETFNLSYAEVATRVAIALGADKLIAFTSQRGVNNKRGQLLRELTLHQCEKLITKFNDAEDDMGSTLQACHQACDQGVPRAQIISYRDNGALIKELFTRDGTGTLVYCDSYETIRRARIDDVGGIIELISPLEKQGVLVRRSRERLETEVDHFTVMEKDGMIVACAALYPFKQYDAGELACVVTHANYRNTGRASKLLKHVERQGQKLKLKMLFTLTTQTAHWFIEQGFAVGDISVLPEEKQLLYNYRRNSKVLVKNLS